MGYQAVLYYKLVPYFDKLGIRYGSVEEIVKETGVSSSYVNKCFSVWLDRERIKNEHKKWFRGLEKPEPYSDNEDDYATIKNYKYNYNELSERETNIKTEKNDRRSFTERLQMALLRKGSDNV